MKIVTIWNTYGPYHIARVEALGERFRNVEITCFSHCLKNNTYPFFDLQPINHRVLVPKISSDLGFSESLSSTLGALWEEKPDLILTIGYERPETLASVIYARFSGKIVFLMMDNQFNDRQRRAFVELIKKIYLKLFHGIIYGGDSHKSYLRKLGVDQASIVPGYNCVDNDAFMQGVVKARNYNPPLVEHPNYFLCVARLVPEKNLISLIQAYAAYINHITKTRSPWSLVFCGEGPERSLIEQAINEYAISDRVVLEGQINDFEQILQYYAFARTLVLPSLIEPWGLVVNEAMAGGLPVIVSSQCGCASNLVRNGENGFTFDGKSVEQLTGHLIWMHENEEKLTKMGARSLEIIQNYSPENFARNVLDLYKKIRKSGA